MRSASVCMQVMMISMFDINLRNNIFQSVSAHKKQAQTFVSWCRVHDGLTLYSAKSTYNSLCILSVSTRGMKLCITGEVLEYDHFDLSSLSVFFFFFNSYPVNWIQVQKWDYFKVITKNFFYLVWWTIYNDQYDNLKLRWFGHKWGILGHIHNAQ